ncbi:hypothetical protein RR46_13059 [Papilio xuthus]|uniref:Uncharacterized protein n=1 Tax=Papilio xuthus TaxID=66420 RepID=A0A194PMD2_PAPXU|nr:hypothetical protein RR46_13059 [Papilio xuthus]
MGFCKNRLYYISSRLKCSPGMLRESLAKRTFIYNLPFDWLESALNVLLDMGVSSERILRDLWVLKYHPKTIHERLQKVKILGVDTLYPWMLKSFLDFLISEGFSIEDIARRPRVLTASQKTVKERLQKLRRLGLKEINLNAVSRSKKDFKKYFASLESVSIQN